MQKIIRTSAVPHSINMLLRGQLAFFSNYFHVTVVSSNRVELEEIKTRERVNVHAIEIKRRIAPMKDLISLFKLYLYFRKVKPLIVHSITPKAGLLSMLAAKFARVPIRMHTFTGLIFPTHKGLMQKILIKMDQLLCWSATNIYPEGSGVKQDLIDYKITPKDLRILANGSVCGIDGQYFNPTVFINDRKSIRKQLTIDTDSFVFIFIGRIMGDKGINELIGAFAELSSKPETEHLKLLLVGAFESDIDPLRAVTVKEIETNSNIHVLGFQSDVRPYLVASDALVLASYREGFPNVVLQAGAMELPSIVTDINGSNEIIVDDINGLIIPSKDTDSLQKAMESLSTDSELYSRLKSKTREMILSHYEQTDVWQATLNEYQRLEKSIN